jgi:hypothetical protein
MFVQFQKGNVASYKLDFGVIMPLEDATQILQ